MPPSLFYMSFTQLYLRQTQSKMIFKENCLFLFASIIMPIIIPANIPKPGAKTHTNGVSRINPKNMASKAPPCNPKLIPYPYNLLSTY